MRQIGLKDYSETKYKLNTFGTFFANDRQMDMAPNSIRAISKSRQKYLEALKAADRADYSLLLAIAQSM